MTVNNTNSCGCRGFSVSIMETKDEKGRERKDRQNEDAVRRMSNSPRAVCARGRANLCEYI